MATTTNTTGIFHYGNDTYIGEFLNNISERDNITSQINGLTNSDNQISSDDCFFVKNPAKITFTLEKVTVSSTSSYEWRWVITPLVPKACIGSNSSFNVFSFPKTSVAVCGLPVSNLDNSIVNAYNSLVS